MGEEERGALTSRCLLFVRSSLEGIFFSFLVLQRGGEATERALRPSADKAGAEKRTSLLV